MIEDQQRIRLKHELTNICRIERRHVLLLYFIFNDKMSYESVMDEQKILMDKKFLFQRWLYVSVGILTMIPIILLTIEQIHNMKKEDNEFALCLLLIIHSGGC